MLEGAGGAVAYVTVLLAAAIESEVVYLVATALAVQGHLHPLGVILAGAAGAALGDQLTFWLLRGRLRSWLDRSASVARAGRRLTAAVRRHRVPLVLAIRFVPGLRVALTAACAYADVPWRLFVVLNTLASLVWAVALLAVLRWSTAAASHALGLSGWWSALTVAAALAAASWAVSRTVRSVSRRDDPGVDAPGAGSGPENARRGDAGIGISAPQLPG